MRSLIKLYFIDSSEKELEEVNSTVNKVKELEDIITILETEEHECEKDYIQALSSYKASLCAMNEARLNLVRVASRYCEAIENSAEAMDELWEVLAS